MVLIESFLVLHFMCHWILHGPPTFLNPLQEETTWIPGSTGPSTVSSPWIKLQLMTVVFCTFIKLVEPLILIKPLTLLLKLCFASCAGTAVIEQLLIFSHWKTYVTSQPGTHSNNCPSLSLKWHYNHQRISQGFVMVWLVTALNCATQWQQDGLSCNTARWLLNWLIDFLTGCHKRTADHTITTTMRGQYVSGFFVFFGKLFANLNKVIIFCSSPYHRKWQIIYCLLFVWNVKPLRCPILFILNEKKAYLHQGYCYLRCNSLLIWWVVAFFQMSNIWKIKPTVQLHQYQPGGRETGLEHRPVNAVAERISKHRTPVFWFLTFAAKIGSLNRKWLLLCK